VTLTQGRPATGHLDLNGVRLHHRIQGDPAGQVVVFVHGWPDSSYSFSRVLPLFPQRYRTVALDLRGFGRSDRPVTGYAMDDLATDVLAALDALGIERATLVGHSMGTFVARRAARLAPDRIANLVLIGSAPTGANDTTREVAGLLADLADPVPLAFVRDFQAGTVHAGLPDPFFEGIVAESALAPAHVWRSAFAGLLAFDDTADLPSIAAPTLLVWGGHDALFDRAHQDDLLTALPDARLVVYPDAGHCPNWERPERLVDDIVAFLLDQTG
jgi:pimeloyl-ACP methyl ester carboxylesterase